MGRRSSKHTGGKARPTGQVQASLQEIWAEEYSPALAPFLAGMGMSGGLVALVPAIGVEGRIFGGSPENPTDNVLVVSAPTDPGTRSEAVYSMLREALLSPGPTGNGKGWRCDAGIGMRRRAWRHEPPSAQGHSFWKCTAPMISMAYQQFLPFSGRSLCPRRGGD